MRTFVFMIAAVGLTACGIHSNDTQSAFPGVRFRSHTATGPFRSSSVSATQTQAVYDQCLEGQGSNPNAERDCGEKVEALRYGAPKACPYLAYQDAHGNCYLGYGYGGYGYAPTYVANAPFVP